MNCPSCSSDNCIVELRTGSDGGPAGVCSKCCQCGHTWRPEGAGNVVPHIEPGLPTAPESSARNIAKPIRSEPAPKVTARSVVAEAKREIKRIDKEIARLEKLKRQRAELARLLEAAKGAPSTVVELRRASHPR